MSTKCTELYGKDFHFYYDYKDFKHHLTIKGEEIDIPNSFKDTLIYLSSIKRAEETINRNISKINKLEEQKWISSL